MKLIKIQGHRKSSPKAGRTHLADYIPMDRSMISVSMCGYEIMHYEIIDGTEADVTCGWCKKILARMENEMHRHN
jgi:hypothetical protein